MRVIDSHTAGEPTRVVVEGVPSLGAGSMAERLSRLRDGFDWVRTSLVTEPRGAEWMVGAALLEPCAPQATAGVVFFNNEGYLGMCGHGMLGVVATLRYLNRIDQGVHLFETPVGTVRATLAPDGSATIENVASYRLFKDVSVTLSDGDVVLGDVAWGGNWFFLVKVDETPMLVDLERWLARAKSIRAALASHGVTGADGAEIDHVELVGPPLDATTANARSFVLCPGGHYDRSPCGTGSSAKAACLAADGRLGPGEVWRQESITGEAFVVTYRRSDDKIIPSITGRAFVNADATIVIDPQDPFCWGVNRSPAVRQA
ncbi:MAG: proline racemase family protein [Planctomycetales bacterium]|nr:proline racemase family protein [Planctomycetales bacterium]